MELIKQRSARHFDIRIGKTNIEQVNEIKYLGAIFNDKLSWKSHIQHVYSSGSCNRGCDKFVPHDGGNVLTAIWQWLGCHMAVT